MLPAARKMRRKPGLPAMRPYPSEWERHDVLRDGTRVFVRPIKPEDAALYPDFLAAVMPDDLRLRFFAPTREVSVKLIAKLTRLDYERAMALIAIDEKTGAMLGVVRLHDDPGGKAGEYAVLVRSHLKGRGLGWLLMQRMIDYARAKNLRRIHGQVLGENLTMLTMCEELGFHIADDADTAGVKVVTLDLNGTPDTAG
jgi:acetyltransferase